MAQRDCKMGAVRPVNVGWGDFELRHCRLDVGGSGDRQFLLGV